MDLRSLTRRAGSKILLLVLDGLGGFSDAAAGTELEEARTPNLDRLASEGVTGLLEPVGPGITPGSGPGHLALFGYDPLEFQLGRGTLSAAGLEFDLEPGDVAARGNLCTIGPDGTVLDRRAGRISDDEGRRVARRLQDEVRVRGVELFFRPERQHRVLVVLRGEGLDPRVGDTDPQVNGERPYPVLARDPGAAHTAEVVEAVLRGAAAVLREETAANGLLVRGFDSLRVLPQFSERYGLEAAAAAVYPMYRGIARLLGFDVLGPPEDLAEEVELIEKHREEADFFFLHHKDPDTAGEDGDRAAKIDAIERLDQVVPDLVAVGFDVVAVTGDHATPSQMAGHSWHPVPVLLWGRRSGRDDVDRFGERWCRSGDLGRRRSMDLMALLLAGAGRLAKYGA